MKADIIQKYSKRSKSWLEKKAVMKFNEFIRLRDSDANGNFVCISCGVMKSKAQLQAGHFYPSGQNPAVRFDERNVNGECVHCNYYSGDHLLKYQPNLIEKIGHDEFEALSTKMLRGKKYYKIDRFMLIDVIDKYTEKVKELKRSKNQ